MTTETWHTVLSRITDAQPLDLDATVLAIQKSRTKRPTPEQSVKGGFLAPSSRLWDRNATSVSFLGIRVYAPLPDVAQAALRLASAALERDVVPIIMTTLPNSGFERFGFRVERLAAENEHERAIAERELSRFWNMALIVDAADIAILG